MRRHSGDSDPVITGGNSIRRVAAAATMSALVLAGCANEAGPRDGTISTPTTLAAPEIATPKEAMFKEQADKLLTKLGKDILWTANISDPRYKTKTTIYSDKPPYKYGGAQAGTSVAIDAGLLIGGGDFGTYRLSVEGDLDASGQKIDPDKITAVGVTMTLRKNDLPLENTAGGFYAFHAHRLFRGDNNWQISYDADTKGGHEHTDYTVEAHPDSFPLSDGQQPEVLTSERFTELDTQALEVFNWALNAQPLNYAPHIS